MTDPHRTDLAARSACGDVKATRALVALRSERLCEIGRAPHCTWQATDWHHRQRRGEGDNTITNALHACRSCHSHAHAHPAAARAAGWIVSAWADPELTPVLRRGRWVLLDRTGGFAPAPQEHA